MRMWMVDSKLLCNKHLLGEHGELHKFLNNWTKKHAITGRIAINAIEPMSYEKRHTELAQEMLSRGMNHQSPLVQPDFSYLPPEQQHYEVNQKQSLGLLHEKCEKCRERGFIQ